MMIEFPCHSKIPQGFAKSLGDPYFPTTETEIC